MNTMALTRPAQQQACRVRLAADPAAAAQARGQVLAAIRAWDVPLGQDAADAAVLLTSELVTNAIRYGTGASVTLTVACCGGQLRVDVHDGSAALPLVTEAPGEAETGRGLMLVATLADEWGYYRTSAGKAVYFTLAYGPDSAAAAGQP